MQTMDPTTSATNCDGVAVEQSAHGAGDAVPTVAVGAVGEDAEASTPQMPLTPWTEMAPTGSSICSV